MKMDELNKILGKRIKNLQETNNLKTEQLAYQSSISKGGLSEIERGMKEPKINTVAKMCAVFNIRMSEFFDFTEIDNFVDLYK